MKTLEACVLRDGRTLAFAQFGDPLGRPMFYFHGFPGSRLEVELGDAAARRHGIRLIAVDRPGYGRSDFAPKRTILDWPDDISDLADHLGLDAFYLVGASGGGPYAAACAWKLPQRVKAAGILCGLGPLDAPGGIDGMGRIQRYGLQVGKWTPWFALPLFGMVGYGIRQNPELLIRQVSSSGPARDLAVFADPAKKQALLDSFLEGLRQGPRGPALDLILYGRPWGFDLEDIRVPVHLWHGEADTIVPPAMGRFVAAKIPNCESRFLPEEGHFSLILDHIEDMFAGIEWPDEQQQSAAG